MINRYKTKKIYVGGVAVGGDAPISNSFYLGGPSTVRGYKSYAFGPSDDEKSYESLKNITSAKYPVIEENYGKSIGVRLLSVSCVSDFAIRIVLANLRELHIIKWEFIFYKNKDGWVLNNISWNDKITELFDTQNRNEP